MAYNMYKQIDKIKETLLNQGYKKDIPIDKFGSVMMILFGMKKNTAIKWLRTFESLNLIKIDDRKVNFIDSI